MSHGLIEQEGDSEVYGLFRFYDVEDVEKVLEKLEEQIKELKEELKGKMTMERKKLDRHNTTMRGWYFADEADAVMGGYEVELRRTKYQLWMARAERARCEAKGWYHSSDGIVHFDATFGITGRLQAPGKMKVRRPAEWERLWVVIENKCRTYAQRFKETK